MQRQVTPHIHHKLISIDRLVWNLFEVIEPYYWKYVCSILYIYFLVILLYYINEVFVKHLCVDKLELRRNEHTNTRTVDGSISICYSELNPLC